MIRLILSAFVCGAAFKGGMKAINKWNVSQTKKDFKIKLNKIKDIITDNDK